ncbi:uncharacterized protein LOC111599077 [Drosophila hydei]|uniref:Uncharacterized protein LOC111599077 n=1 Tax=Drosophila hydei TaxID=7224 RepID=A0A6J1LV65_DROHY|nr:uncharacterized protein LOC111599077 [Drosophila hydei]
MNQFVSGILLTLLLAALLLAPTEAAVARGIFKDAKHPGKCYVSENVILSPGEYAKYPKMDCARIICASGSMAEIHTCGVEAPPPGFKFGKARNPNADYPDCCQHELVKAEDCAAKYISSI